MTARARGWVGASDVSGDVFINRDIEAVFDFVADEHDAYDPRLRSAELLTDGG